LRETLYRGQQREGALKLGAHGNCLDEKELELWVRERKVLGEL